MKIFGIILLVFFLVFGGVLFVIKQPMFFVSKKIENNIGLSDSQTLKEHVQVLSNGERFTEIGLEKSSAYILKVLEDIGVDENSIKIQKYSKGDREYHNIVVHFLKFGKQKDIEKKYVIGAHYDGHGVLPGADDNASGVSGLLEIARILSEGQKSLDLLLNKNIELVFYSTEEMPNFSTETMGSYVHAKGSQDIEMAIILEMIGYYSDEKGSQSFPVSALKYIYSDTGNYIALISNFSNISSVRKVKNQFRTFLGDNSNIYVDSMNAPSLLVPQISFSDHSSYWKFGVPALMVTDTAFLRNKNYHTSEDTYEKLDYERMKEVVDAVIYTILNIK